MSRAAQAKIEFKVNGFSTISNYLSDSEELSRFKNKLHKLVCIKAKQYNVKAPINSSDSISLAIIELNAINKKIGAFLNDTLNASPELFQLLNSENIHALKNNNCRLIFS